jgi:hypothetical protein
MAGHFTTVKFAMVLFIAANYSSRVVNEYRGDKKERRSRGRTAGHNG